MSLVNWPDLVYFFSADLSFLVAENIMIISNNKDSAVYLTANFRLYLKQIFNKEEMLYQQGYHQPMFLVILRSKI